MSDWSYSILAHDAKVVGGPQMLRKKYVNKGRAEMLPLLLLCTVVSPIVTNKVKKYIVKKTNNKKDVINKEETDNVSIHGYDTRGTERGSKEEEL